MDGRAAVWPWTWNTFTMGVMVLISICQFLRWCFSRFRQFSSLGPSPNFTVPPSSALPQPRDSGNSLGSSASVYDSDLKNLLDDLNDKIHRAEEWESVVDKKSNLFSYSAKRTKPEDGPVKYMSVTVFENCSTELLRSFYMDNIYRKTWDKTIIEHEQLHVDLSNGTEIGRTIKKFPFLSPREYVLAWRVWEDKHGAFYCLSKGCEHLLAPRQKKYVRVIYHRSGWRIRKVGRNACEIRMVHQEDAGMNVEMAKLAFSKGIWSYICKMNDALRLYSIQFTPVLNAAMLVQKFPPGLETSDDTACTADPEFAADINCGKLASEGHTSKSSKRPSKKFFKNGLILVGSAICLSRGHSSLGAKVAMVYILTRFTKHGAFPKIGKTGKS